MKYWTIVYPDENENAVFETLSEDEILRQYWDYWYGRMCKKYGKEHVDVTYSPQDCIDDWTCLHWAVEATETKS